MPIDDLQDIILTHDKPMRDAMKIIQCSNSKIVMVVDEDNKLLGTVTDGDIRRALLNNMGLDAPVGHFMNTSPTTASPDDKRLAILAVMRKNILRQIPKINNEGRLIGIETLDDNLNTPLLENEVIIMAGGRGERLKPFTDNTPKPMLHVGGKPILERIIESLYNHGFRKFTITLNYKADAIEDYFGDGKNHGVDISYIKEEKRLGTAGSLSLLPKTPKNPFLIINGDILTQVNFHSLVTFHVQHNSVATMCVREYFLDIPFGVVTTDDHYITDIKEKPEQRHLINAGIYMLNSEVLSRVPKDQYFDMPDLFNILLDEEKKLTAFHINEEWIDVGRIDHLTQAQNKFVIAS